MEDKQFSLKNRLKYKEKQPPYCQYFCDGGSVVMYDSLSGLFCRLNAQSREFEEIYKIGRHNPHTVCVVSADGFIYMIERDSTGIADSYSLTKRAFDSPGVVGKIDLEIPDTAHYRKTGFKDEIGDAFFFGEYVIIPHFRWSEEYCILSKETGKCLFSGSGKIVSGKNSRSVFILENGRELYSMSLDGTGFSKKRLGTFLTDKQTILDIIDYGDFCILEAGEWKTNFEPFSRIVFGHKRRLVRTTYYCIKKGDALVDGQKMNERAAD